MHNEFSIDTEQTIVAILLSGESIGEDLDALFKATNAAMFSDALCRRIYELSRSAWKWKIMPKCKVILPGLIREGRKDQAKQAYDTYSACFVSAVNLAHHAKVLAEGRKTLVDG